MPKVRFGSFYLLCDFLEISFVDYGKDQLDYLNELLLEKAVPKDAESRDALGQIVPELLSMDVMIQDLIRFEPGQGEIFPLNELGWYVFCGDERVRVTISNARLPRSNEEVTGHVYPEITYRRYCRRPKMCRFCRTEYARLGFCFYHLSISLVQLGGCRGSRFWRGSGLRV
jgi:hypothetical protein